jgi:hypothetical protein
MTSVTILMLGENWPKVHRLKVSPTILESAKFWQEVKKLSKKSHNLQRPYEKQVDLEIKRELGVHKMKA